MIRINEFDCVALEEYKGKYSLVLGYEKRDGGFGAKWCKMEFGKGNEKNVPVKIPLGEKYDAINVLNALVDELTGENTQETGDDAPF